MEGLHFPWMFFLQGHKMKRLEETTNLHECSSESLSDMNSAPVMSPVQEGLRLPEQHRSAKLQCRVKRPPKHAQPSSFQGTNPLCAPTDIPAAGLGAFPLLFPITQQFPAVCSFSSPLLQQWGEGGGQKGGGMPRETRRKGNALLVHARNLHSPTWQVSPYPLNSAHHQT